MASNQKLTRLLAGRTLQGSAQEPGLLTLSFADGSTMKIKVAPAATNVAVNSGAKVKKVRQKGTELDLDFADGTTWTVQTAEATSSVMLRDHAGKLEYAD